ncbi:hypothetical protein DsansV1_C49g0244031 [Dioscorea sansibarensis]
MIRLKLRTTILDENELIEQLVDVISEELGHTSSVSSGTILWTDTSKMKRLGIQEATRFDCACSSSLLTGFSLWFLANEAIEDGGCCDLCKRMGL